MTSVPVIAAALAVGLVIGVLSGLLGIGGGTVMIPVFKLGFGMPAVVCTATSLFAVILTAISGSITHLRNKTCVPRLGLALGLGGAVTSPLGVWLANISPDWAIMVAATLVIAYSAVTMFRKALKAPRRASAGRAESELDEAACDRLAPQPGASVAETMRPGRRQLAVAAGIGMLAGVASGYVGLGGGFLMVPLMMQLLRMPMRLTSGTSLIAVMILAIPGVALQATYGNVDWLAGICVALGTMPGAVVGARLTERMPERALRFTFSGFLLVAAALLVLDQLHIL